MTKALRSLSDLPPFSPVLTKLLATLGEEDVSFSNVSDLIEKDTVVAGNILHLVNSAMYGRRASVSSVRHAVSLLGMTKLRNAVLGMSIARVWNRVKVPASWSMARFNMHSAAVAVLSDLLAQHIPVIYPEGGFVAGLLHDMGRLLMALSLPAEYEAILKLYAAGGQSLSDCERQVLGFAHAELSAEALQIWKLPDPICDAVLHHHDPAPEMSLARIIAAADQYVDSAGVSILVHNGIETGAITLESLGLNSKKLASILETFREEHQAMAGFFR